MIVILGKSGTGKTSVINKINEKYNLEKIITCTNRIKRSYESNDIDYIFYTNDEFEEKIKNKEFFEWSYHKKNLYGTLNKNLNNHMKKSIDVDEMGLTNFEIEFGKENIFSILLVADENIRRKRMLKKGIKELNIDKIQHNENMFTYDRDRVNICVDTSCKNIEQIYEIIDKELQNSGYIDKMKEEI